MSADARFLATRTGLSDRALVDLVAVGLLAAAATLGFGPAFSGWPGYLAAGGGALLGMLIGVLASWRRIGLLWSTIAVIVGYLLLVGPLALRDTLTAGVLPTLETLERGSLLIVESWRDLLTVSVPADSFSGPAVVPFLACLVCTCIGAALAMRARRRMLALIPMVVLLLIAILWGAQSAPGGPLIGGGVAAVVLAWTAIRDRHPGAADPNSAVEVETTGRAGRMGRRLGAAATVLAVALAVSAVAAPALMGGRDRFVLRDVVHPPLDMRSYASPLMSYRYLERDQRTTKLFRVDGLPVGARVRLATLDAYDGIVFNVEQSSAGYARVGSRIEYSGERSAPTSTASYTISGYSGVWLPGGGALSGVEFTGGDVRNLRSGIFYNADTGTLLDTVGVDKSTRYTTSVAWPTRPGAAALASDRVATVALPDVTGIPDVVGTRAAAYTEGASTPLTQLRAIEKHLQQGYYSNGSDGRSLSGHGAARITSMLSSTQLVGDDEQYAVAMALMARQMGYPARVVMGFYPAKGAQKGTTWTATGNDAHAWVEVAFQKSGWVGFDPTPDRNRHPRTTVPKPRPQPRPQVQPPPIPPEEPAEPPMDVAGNKHKEDEHAGRRLIWQILKIAGVSAGALLVLSSPVLAVAALRRRRRKGRLGADSPADQLSGGWAEVLDAARDLGTRVDSGATRQEVAAQLTAVLPNDTAVPLASQIDAGVFGPAVSSPDHVTQVWRQVDATIEAMRRGAPRKRRLAYFVTWAALVHPASTRPASLGRGADPKGPSGKNPGARGPGAKAAVGAWMRRLDPRAVLRRRS